MMAIVLPSGSLKKVIQRSPVAIGATTKKPRLGGAANRSRMPSRSR